MSLLANASAAAYRSFKSREMLFNCYPLM